MNDHQQSYQDHPYDMNQLGNVPHFEYDQDMNDCLKMQGDQVPVYDNYQQNINQMAYHFNSSNEQQQLSGYHDNDLQTMQDFQHGRYQDYSPNDIDPYSQILSPAEYSPISQNISPASFSSDGRPFFPDQMEGTPTSVPYYQHNVPTMQQNLQNLPSKEDMPPIHSNDSSYSDLKSQVKPPPNITGETSKSVNGILEMEGSVEPNGPILGGHGYIPAQTMQKAYYDLGETPEIKAACIRGLRQQIDIHQEENNFDEHSDAFLLKFLRSRKFDVEAAYALLEKYYNVRENKPEVFRNLTRKNVKRTMEQGIVGVLPQRDKKGRVIMTFNFSKWNMSLPFHFEKLLRVFVYTLEKLFESEETQINGVVVICNLTQLSVLQTKSLGAAMIEKVIEIFEVSAF